MILFCDEYRMNVSRNPRMLMKPNYSPQTRQMGGLGAVLTLKRKFTRAGNQSCDILKVAEVVGFQPWTDQTGYGLDC
jgi:hypothetical protein